MKECIPDPKLALEMRRRTNLPLFECRFWLTEHNNNLEEAIKAAREDYFQERTGKPWQL